MFGRVAGLLTLLFIIAPASASEGDLVPETGRRRALLIGIQSYSRLGDDWSNLRGPLNDVALLKEVLARRYGFSSENVTTLLDEAATGAAIRMAFETLIEDSLPGDIVYIHYSGHGSRVVDANGDEGDRRKDSTLVPIDGHSQGAYEILDDEIGVWLRRLRRVVQHVTLVVDACHSGTISRAYALETRVAPLEDARSYAWSDTLDMMEDPRDSGNAGLVRLSACRDLQRAYEYRAKDDKVYGLFTWHWAEALQKARPGDTYGDVFRRTEALTIGERGQTQVPIIEGESGLALLGSDRPPSEYPLAVISVKANQVEVRGGLLDGITEGSLYRSAEDPESVVRIDSLGAFQSWGTVSRGETPDPGQILQLFRRSYPFHALGFEIRAEEGFPSGLALDLRDDLAKVDGLEFLESGVPDLLLLLTGGERPTCEFLDAAGRPFGGFGIREGLLSLPLSAATDIPRIRVAARTVLENRLLLDHAERCRGDYPRVKVDVVRLRASTGDDPPELIYRTGAERLGCDDLPSETVDTGFLSLAAGERIAFRVRNGEPRPIYAHILNLTPSGGVQSFYPTAQTEGHLHPGEERLLQGSGRELNLADSGYLDTYVVYLTASPGSFLGLDRADLTAPDLPVSAMRGAGRWGDLQGVLLGGSTSAMRSGKELSPPGTRKFIIRVEDKKEIQ